MNFIADENIDSAIVELLRSNSHAVRYIAEFDRGADDEQILHSANINNELLITADKDFGEIVFRQKRVTQGVLLIRLPGLSSQTKAETVLARCPRTRRRVAGKLHRYHTRSRPNPTIHSVVRALSAQIEIGI